MAIISCVIWSCEKWVYTSGICKPVSNFKLRKIVIIINKLITYLKLNFLGNLLYRHFSNIVFDFQPDFKYTGDVSLLLKPHIWIYESTVILGRTQYTGFTMPLYNCMANVSLFTMLTINSFLNFVYIKYWDEPISCILSRRKTLITIDS